MPGAQRFSAPKQRKRTWAPPCGISRRGCCSSSSVRRRVAIILRVNLDAIELSPSPPVDSTIEPALRIPNYKECVAEKGHEACANLLPFFQWLYEHGIDVAA